MANIACQNPNKKVREALTQYVPGKTYKNIDAIFSQFSKGKDPIKIANEFGYDSNEIASLFGLWLNSSRCPRFIFLEDFTLNKQVESMIKHSGSIGELYELHNYIYKNAPMNAVLYNYFWIKYKHQDYDLYKQVLHKLFEREVELSSLIKHLPHVYPTDIARTFCDFAEHSKETHRSYIAENLVSRSELNKLLEESNNLTNDMLKESPELIKQTITCELYRRGFFKI
jgi:hypothetical protein